MGWFQTGFLVGTVGGVLWVAYGRWWERRDIYRKAERATHKR